MKRGPGLLLGVVLLALLAAAPAVHAFDNTNSTDLQQSQTVNQQLLGTTVAQMAQQTNDPTLQALASQFEQAMNSGDPLSEQQALANLQSYSALASDSPALSALVRSMSSTGSGITVNQSTLASLLGAFTPDGQGVPSNLVGENPTQLAFDMNSIVKLMGGVDPSLASQLLNEMEQMSVSFPNLSSLGPLSGLSSVSPGALPVAAPAISAAGSSMDLVRELAVPAAMGAAAAVLFVLRNRLRSLMRGQTLPVAPQELELEEYGGDPGTPRARVMRAFNGMLQVMSGKGVVRGRGETHREFSNRCRGRDEGPSVGRISGYFEKAKFSAAEVTEDDARESEGALSGMTPAGDAKR